MGKSFIVLIFIILAVIAGYFLFTENIHAPSELINKEQIMSEVDKGTATLLDVRTEEERISDGYAAGSTHFDIGLLRDGELPNIDKDQKVYVYCRSGSRAEEAKEILEANGFLDVVNIGGLTDWLDAGGEVIKDK